MGRKQKRLWKYILFFPAVCLIILNILTGCQLSVDNSDLLPQHDNQGDLSNISLVKDAPSKQDILENQLLDQAEASLKGGKLAPALRFVAQAISCCDGHSSDRALNIIERVLTHPENGCNDYNHCMDCLKQLEAAFPKSGYGSTTGCWLVALSEMLDTKNENRVLRNIVGKQKRKIQRLESQLSQLKAVDLELVQPESALEVP